MEKVLMYITNHYIYFALGALFLIIATVGYVAEEKREKIEKAKEAPAEDKKTEENKTSEKK